VRSCVKADDRPNPLLVDCRLGNSSFNPDHQTEPALKKQK
jgi:hypothetical protein